MKHRVGRGIVISCHSDSALSRTASCSIAPSWRLQQWLNSAGVTRTSCKNREALKSRPRLSARTLQLPCQPQTYTRQQLAALTAALSRHSDTQHRPSRPQTQRNSVQAHGRRGPWCTVRPAWCRKNSNATAPHRTPPHGQLRDSRVSTPVSGFVPFAMLHRYRFWSFRSRTSVQSEPSIVFLENCALVTCAASSTAFVKSAASRSIDSSDVPLRSGENGAWFLRLSDNFSGNSLVAERGCCVCPR